MKWIIVVLVFVSLAGACTFHNEEEYFGDLPCDSLKTNRTEIEVYYNDLEYIFTGVCANCHFPNNPYRANIVMNNYNSVVSSVKTGLVMKSIQHTGRYKMPNGLPKLSDCEIQRISVWIENGMPEKSN